MENIADTLLVNNTQTKFLLNLTVKGDPIFYFPLDTNKDITWMKGDVATEAPANSLIIGKVN